LKNDFTKIAEELGLGVDAEAETEDDESGTKEGAEEVCAFAEKDAEDGGGGEGGGIGDRDSEGEKASERMAKKVAEAERLMRKGMEYCQMERSLNQFPREMRTFWLIGEWGCGFAEDFRASSQRSAPRRMIALVAPHTIPTAIIFSISAPSLSLSLTALSFLHAFLMG